MQMTLLRAESAGYMTNWTARLFARAIDQQLKGSGVSHGMLPVLFALSGGAAMTQKALAEMASVEQPTMAATLSRMEREGLIVRRPDPADRRSQLVALTPAAAVKVRRVKRAVAAVNDVAFQGMSQKERTRFMTAMATMVASLEAHLGKAAAP